jgi:hypothetical protein
VPPIRFPAESTPPAAYATLQPPVDVPDDPPVLEVPEVFPVLVDELAEVEQAARQTPPSMTRTIRERVTTKKGSTLPQTVSIHDV